MNQRTRTVGLSYARGAMGGLLVSVPVLMTMEMWWSGFTVPAWRLLLLLAVIAGVLLILQHYSGTTPATKLTAEARAALVTLGIGIATSALALFAVGALHDDLSLRDLAGKLLLQAVPVSIGASVAMSEFGHEHDVMEQRRKHAGYWDALGMALGGAMLFGFGISATEEPLLVAEQLNWIRALVLMAFSLAQVHAIVYAVDLKQHPERARTWAHALDVLREGVSTYAMSLVVGAYLLWTFGTISSGSGLVESIYATIAIGFVTSLGAAAAELLI